jgi:hypothetical protein
MRPDHFSRLPKRPRLIPPNREFWGNLKKASDPLIHFSHENLASPERFALDYSLLIAAAAMAGATPASQEA